MTGRFSQNRELICPPTPARGPLIRAKQIGPGTHITAMGSDDEGKQELDPRLLQTADIVVADGKTQCLQYGEISHAVRQRSIEETDILGLVEAIRDPNLARTSDDQIYRGRSDRSGRSGHPDRQDGQPARGRGEFCGMMLGHDP